MVVYICQDCFPHSSHFFLPSTVSIRLFSISASPLIPCKEVQQYHIYRFHISELVYYICFFLTLPCITVLPTYLELTQIPSFLWLILHYVCVPDNLTTGHIPRENHNWKRHVHPDVHRSTIYNNKDMEALL